jgi:hypothetical protein
MHSGIGGLAHAMAEIRLSRAMTAAEQALGDAIAEVLVLRIPGATEYDYFDGLTSTIGILVALDAPGADLAVARLCELATPDGWPTSWVVAAPFGARRRRWSPRRLASARRPNARSRMASRCTGASWSIAMPIRCFHRAPAGCRARPVSRRTSSVWPDCWKWALKPRASGGWTPGGRFRADPATDRAHVRPAATQPWTRRRMTQRHLAILRSRSNPNSANRSSGPVWKYAPRWGPRPSTCSG